jgi:predicted nucleic acid-binding protein
MIVYLDSSGLVKRYVEEAGSAEVAALCQSAELVAISVVGYAEVMAALARRQREGGMPQDAYKVAVGRFKDDWQNMDAWGLTNQVNDLVERLVYRHPLRGFDAIHLATALARREESQEEMQFVCADLRLRAAAREEGLAVLP